MFVIWGTAQQLFYNEAYAAILGERHPAAFGEPILRVWADIALTLEPLVSRAYGGESIPTDDSAFAMLRGGELKEAHFSFSCTPICGDTTEDVLGVFCACAQTTGLVQQQNARKEEARRLHLFDNVPGFMAVLNGPDHVFEFANKAYYRAVGGRDLIGRSVRQAFPELAQQGFLDVLDGVYATGRRYLAQGISVQLCRNPGLPEETRVLDFVYEPIIDAEGAVTGIFVAGFDSTDSVEAQREARESHARRKEVLDSMGEGFIMLGEDYRLLEINAEGLRLDGRTAAQIVGRPYWEVFPATLGTIIETSYRRVMDERAPICFQHRYVNDLHDLLLEVRAFPVKGGIAAFYRDVTLIAQAQTNLRHSHDRFSAAIEAVGVMWTNSAEGFMNGEQPGWAALTGQTQAEYSGFGWANAVHPDDAQPTMDAWTSAVADRSLFILEHRVRRRDGAWRRFAIRAVPVVDQDEGLREWVGVHIDITDQAAAAEALLAADRRKDEFLATLAHELRNPLAAV
ncbi:MAG: PAS domain-containing protein, partial [Ramlibacter sp.]|nr:PAS domain-containing protein [Ramlibacter sp.]